MLLDRELRRISLANDLAHGTIAIGTQLPDISCFDPLHSFSFLFTFMPRGPSLTCL